MAPAWFFLLAFTATVLAQDSAISQISDGQIQGPTAVLAPATPQTIAPAAPPEESSATAAPIAVSAPTQATLNATVTAPKAVPQSPLPTSILQAAPVGAPGAVSNYTGLTTLAPAAPPKAAVPVPGNGTYLNATSAVPSSLPSAVTTAAPTEATATEAPSSTSTSAPEAAKGAASRHELGVMMVVFAVGSLMKVML